MRTSSGRSVAPREGRLALRLTSTVILAIVTGAGWASTECRPRVDVEDGGVGIRLRTHVDAFTPCTIDEAGYRALVGGWLSGASQSALSLRWIALGRIVDYPWLERALAAASLDDPAWDRRRGRVRAGSLEGLARRALERPALLERLEAPLRDAGLQVRSVSLEKVLVAPAGAILPDHPEPRALVVHDAQIWLQLDSPTPQARR